MASILFVTAFPPNKRTAGQNYTRQLLNDLVRENDVDLIYWDFPNHELDVSDQVKVVDRIATGKMKYDALFHLWLFPLFSKRFSSKVHKWIAGNAHKYDMLYFDYSQTFVLSRNIKHPLKIGMCHDIIAQKFERQKAYSPFLPWIKWCERTCLKDIGNLFTFSNKDSEILKTLYNRDSIPVNFYIEQKILDVDLDEVRMGDYFIMYGAWNRKENQQSILWVLDKIGQCDINIKVIGGGMPIEITNRINKFKNIEYLGFVDNPYPVIAASKGLIAPLFNGAGVKVKVIESLALGTPVIGTDITFEGIDSIPVKNGSALINLTHNELMSSLNELISLDISQKKEIREKFLTRYNSSKFIDQIEHLK